MSCEGRFARVEGGILPAVTNYDYPDTNLAIRGTQDRSFQFQEVCSISSYLFQETGVNGEFLINSGLVPSSETNISGRWIWNHASAELAATYYSGWYIGSSTGEILSSYTTGHYIFDIPQSGAGAGGPYDPLSPMSAESAGSFYAQPVGLVSNAHAVALFDDTANDSSPGNGVHLVQTGLQLVTGQTYQAYAAFQQPYNLVSAPVSFYIEAYTGGAATDPLHNSKHTAFYSSDSAAWSTSRPASTVSPTARPSEVSFEFTVDDLSPVPSGFNVHIAISGQPVATETNMGVVVVSSVHIDALMKKNAFTDIVLPSGYLIQMTPDLGWHDTLSMFGEREAPPNPHLSTLGPYSLASGMVDNQDGSAILTVSDTDFADATSSHYRKYLWRTIAISENGAPGAAGFPRRFTYLGKIFDEEFSVDKVWDDPLSITKLITGTKSKRMSILVDGATHIGMEYPTDKSWKLTVVMDAPTKHISIQGKDKGGALTSEHFIDLVSTTIGLSEKALWNVFDEHGLLLGVDRLPDESNENFASRIKDSYQSPGSHFFKGVVDGATRELGLNKSPRALVLFYKNRQTPSPLLLTVDVTSSSVLLRTSDLVYTEVVRIDPIDLTCEVTERISDDPTLSEIVDGTRVNIDQIRLFDEKSERPDFRKLQFTDESLGGKLVKLTYPYYREYTFATYPTLADLIPALATYTDTLGNSLIEVVLAPDLSGFEASEGLYIKQTNFAAGALAIFGWSPVHLKKIGDRIYRESFRNPDGTLWNTKFYKWVIELKSNTNIEWGHVIADKAYWDAADNKLNGFDHLPTLMDPAIANYVHPSGQKLDPEEVLARGYLDEIGAKLKSTLLVPNDFVPGVAYIPDLLPTIFSTVSASPEIADVPDVVVGRTGNAPITFFSGNIH